MSWRSRIALCFSLVGVFFFLYFLLQPAQRSGAPSASSAILRDWVPLLLLFVFFVAFMIFVRRAMKGTRLNNQGVALMQQARYLAALEKFQAALPVWRSPLIPYNVGIARLNLWQVHQALPFFEKAWNSRLTNLKHLAAPYLALASAIEGRSEAARKWLGEAATRGNSSSSHALLAEGVLACRAGDWPEAAAVLQRNELNALGGPQRGLVEALRSWCLARQGVSRPVDRVALFGEASPDALRALWPEFVEFVEKAA